MGDNALLPFYMGPDIYMGLLWTSDLLSVPRSKHNSCNSGIWRDHSLSPSLSPVRSQPLSPLSAETDAPRPVKCSTYCAPIVPQDLQGAETPRSGRNLPSAAIGRPKAWIGATNLLRYTTPTPRIVRWSRVPETLQLISQGQLIVDQVVHQEPAGASTFGMRFEVWSSFEL